MGVTAEFIGGHTDVPTAAPIIGVLPRITTALALTTMALPITMALALTTVLPTFTAVPAFTLVLGVGTGGEVATSETLSA
jgi:hypothetical protein